MKKMYPAIVNSPETVTRGELGQSGTIVEVSDSGILTGIPVPFPLTLGKGATAETVLLKEINGDTLTIERGFQGVPRLWAAGTVLSRNFTAYDHDTFKENIETASEKLAALEDSVSDLTTDVQIGLENLSQSSQSCIDRLSEELAEVRSIAEIGAGGAVLGDINELIFRQTITEAVSEHSSNWAFTHTRHAGRLLAETYDIESPELLDCQSIEDVVASREALSAVAASKSAMVAVAASSYIMRLIGASRTAMSVMWENATACSAIESSPTATTVLSASPLIQEQTITGCSTTWTVKIDKKLYFICVHNTSSNGSEVIEYRTPVVPLESGGNISVKCSESYSTNGSRPYRVNKFMNKLENYGQGSVVASLKQYLKFIVCE